MRDAAAPANCRSTSRVAAIAAGVSVVAMLAGSGCAPGRVRLPSGDGEPYADFGRAWSDARSQCGAVRTLTAEVAVSGRVAGGRLRGRVLVGFERPDRLRLEAVAPAGPPVFILVASAGTSTLLVPRTSEILDGEPAEAVLEALVGVSLKPAELGAILSGCLVSDTSAVAGRMFRDHWLRVDLEGGAAAFLQSDGGRWRIRAGSRPGLAIEYDLAPGVSIPRRIGLRTTETAGGGASLQLRPAGPEVGTPIDPGAFSLNRPPVPVPITLSDLRAASPLGARLR